MLFNSQVFVFVFLPLILLGYYLLAHYKKYDIAKAYLCLGSFVFYGYLNPKFLLLLGGSILVNYLIYLILMQEHIKYRKVITILGVCINLASIIYFKYFNFLAGNINRIFKTDIYILNVVLPLGISFFTFQQISFLVDTYKRETERYSFLDYALFVAFFPQLVAGPIVLHKDLISQFTDEKRFRYNSENMLIGIRYFVIGLFKKTMMADRLSLIVTYGYNNYGTLNTVEAILIIISYTLQIYYDFSGYSDMAIGLGKMLGYDLPINFNEPYKAKNIAEFWDRWHMTMTRFFTRYLYIPLGGSRKGKTRTYINTMIVFTLSGLWHGAGWTFIIWGMMHGVLMVCHRVLKKWIDKMPKIISTIVTYCFVNIAWVLFRAEYFFQAKTILIHVIKGGVALPQKGLVEVFVGDNIIGVLRLLCNSEQMVTVLVVILFIAGIVLYQGIVWFAPSSHIIAKREQIGKAEGIYLAIMAVASVMTFMNVSEFLYFNF